MGSKVSIYKDFHKELKSKKFKSLSELDLRREIILFFDTIAWRNIFEIKKNLVALGIVKKTRRGFDVL